MNVTASKPRSFFSTWGLPLLVVVIVIAVIAFSRCPAFRPQAQDFSLPVITANGSLGGSIRLSDQRGKVVLIDFFATWCRPCRRSIPTLVRLHQRFESQGLVVWGIDEDEDAEHVVPIFRDAYDIRYPLLLDLEHVGRNYNVTGLPTLFLIDRQGRVRYTHVGEVDEAELTSQIESAL